MEGLVVDLFIASLDNAKSAGPGTNLALSRLAFLGLVAKVVEFRYCFEWRVWYSTFL